MEGGRQGGRTPPQFLADQLTLSRPWGAHYPHPVLLAPPDFQTLRHACYVSINRYHTYCVLQNPKIDSVTHTLYTRMVYAHSTPHFLCRYYCNAGRPKNYPQCRPQSSPMPILGCGHLYTTLLINSANARRALCSAVAPPLVQATD